MTVVGNGGGGSSALDGQAVGAAGMECARPGAEGQRTGRPSASNGG
jgi:hypothetical protein